MTQDGPGLGMEDDAGEVLSDIVEADLLELQPGERLWKLYCFRDQLHPTGLRHRIYTKQRLDGRLALVTYAAHRPVQVGAGDGDQRAGASTVRSALARVPDLSSADLDRLTSAIREQAASAECHEVDLTGLDTIELQIARLHSLRQDRA